MTMNPTMTTLSRDNDSDDDDQKNNVTMNAQPKLLT